MGRPEITVVTVTLNAAEQLPLTIESVLGQDYPNIEYILVDGLSHDSTHDVIARYKSSLDRVLFIEDGGVYHAMNAAAAEARGEFVLFLNAGDRFYCADAVEALVERRRADSDIFYGDHVYVDGHKEIHVRSSNFGSIQRRLLHGQIDRDWHLSMPCHQSTFTRTSLLCEMGYDTRYDICADHDLLLRAAAGGARLQYIDDIVAHYFAGGMSGVVGPLVHREWAHAYRKHSMRPMAVDRYFFGADTASPFPARTSASGLLLGGAHVEEPSPNNSNMRWRWATQVGLAAPELDQAVGIEIKGHSLHRDQVLSINAKDETLARAVLGEGPFELRRAFVRPISPGEVIQILPQVVGRLAPYDAREAGWGFESLDFIPCAMLDEGGFCPAILHHEAAHSILIDGWEQKMSSADQVRAVADQATIAFRTHRPALQLTIECAGDPDALPGLEVTVVVNGEIAGRMPCDPDGSFQVCLVDVAMLWRQGANIVQLCSNRGGRIQGDVPGAGFAIRHIGWSGVKSQ